MKWLYEETPKIKRNAKWIINQSRKKESKVKKERVKENNKWFL